VTDRPRGVGVLLLVSRRWHDTTIGNRCLWRHIEIDFDVPDARLIHILQRYAEACLVRGRGLPLWIKIDLSNWKSKSEWLRFTIDNLFREINEKKFRI
jgi:hypothetical protein